ncbi:hypothetical protein [Bradyrhizobium retamae]|uniref:hypothetical protein n=1 Tax=Bradyrhizobium retamae TaxID=1300035 RepID=UPI000AE4232C|nr:hypothetical protein [Bradyrhizobium retamae]
MTVASEVNRSGPYIGNGVTTIFNYGFRILDEDHLKVIRTEAGVETVLVIDTDYIVSDVGEASGGQVALTVAPTATQTITILRNVPFTQETDLENQGAYFAETIEAALDLAVMRDQELSERVDRSDSAATAADRQATAIDRAAAAASVAAAQSLLAETVEARDIAVALSGPAPANTFKANATGATAPPQDITGAQAAALLPVFASGAKGVVPAPTAGDIADGAYLNAAGIWVPKKVVRIPGWLTIIRHSATSTNGTSSGTWAFPGNALSASTVMFNYGSFITGCKLYSARWVVAWNPNATTASPNGVALATADSGPTNVVHISVFTRASTTTPVVDGADVTATLQALITAGTSKFICHQVVGNGTTGPMIYSSEIELMWEFTGT